MAILRQYANLGIMMLNLPNALPTLSHQPCFKLKLLRLSFLSFLSFPPSIIFIQIICILRFVFVFSHVICFAAPACPCVVSSLISIQTKPNQADVNVLKEVKHLQTKRLKRASDLSFWQHFHTLHYGLRRPMGFKKCEKLSKVDVWFLLFLTPTSKKMVPPNLKWPKFCVIFWGQFFAIKNQRNYDKQSEKCKDRPRRGWFFLW